MATLDLQDGFQKMRLATGVIVAAFCLYAALFIYRSSFVLEGERYFCLFDDAMVSMRYAKNLAQGAGLVWNPGAERVEGYTNLLWVLYMALVHLLPLAPSKTSLVIQASGALFLLANVLVVKRIAALVSGNSAIVAMGAAVLTAFYFPLNNWGLQGTEVSILTLLISLAVWKTLLSLQSGAFSLWPYLILGVGTLVRLDMAVPYLALLAFFALADRAGRVRHLALGLLILVAFILPQTLFRAWYYGDLLPNTYYLKLTGYPLLLRITRGIYVTWLFVYGMNPLLFLLPFALLLFRRNRAVLLLFSLFLAQIGYSIYVGGDAWEGWGGSNRYVSIVMPLFFVLFCMSVVRFVSSLLNRLLRRPRPLWPYTGAAAFVLLLVSLVSFNATHGLAGLREWLLIDPPPDRVRLGDRIAVGLIVRRYTAPQARVAVVWAGATPYFADRYAIDMLGKNDKHIAREAMRMDVVGASPTAFYPGHLKWDLAYSIGQLKPDVVTQFWGTEGERRYLEADYIPVSIEGYWLQLRRDSANVLWDRLSLGASP